MIDKGLFDLLVDFGVSDTQRVDGAELFLSNINWYFGEGVDLFVDIKPVAEVVV